ncbi:MAG TPA: 4Fe-4S dicluster domain-containing protein [Methanobacteriales archaeon]|jgi:membrane-bound hydrogenase subunit ehbL|nr:MAG: Energy-converting hydrogenase B, subunit L [Methanobacteriaceae archaeon 41_258]MBC7088934.1 4Fe-4S dicluster domain-containing protein [Methanobacteriaceae archaeon]MBC7097056.1 4Fe-4S dicluster domain-containing protein [Methanobacteriales archaeon]MDI3483629.1 energy-converting hydrogenase subunit [Methanobacteriaceae archaeon]HIH62598.1 4Fe-4S dicluster domain-containing protein [Methanobacteriales archaeon]
MKNLLRILLEGAYTNIKRIFFAADRVTDMELRKKILTGKVEPTPKVAEIPCIGCGGCSNACPTKAIQMKDLEEPIEIAEGLIKRQIPVLDSEKCVYCYYCHDFCPLYALFGEPGTIHPNDVGIVEFDVKEAIEKPVKIPDEKLKFITQFLSDKSILEREKTSRE